MHLLGWEGSASELVTFIVQLCLHPGEKQRAAESGGVLPIWCWAGGDQLRSGQARLCLCSWLQAAVRCLFLELLETVIWNSELLMRVELCT